MAAARDFAISRFANDLLDSVDNLDRALLTVPEVQLRLPPDDGADGTGEAPNKDLVNLHDGLKMTERVLMSTLTKHGLVRFDPSQSGERFDPSLHEATFMAPVEGKEDGTVFNTIQKGFKLNGRVIRVSRCNSPIRHFPTGLFSTLTCLSRRPKSVSLKTHEIGGL